MQRSHKSIHKLILLITTIITIFGIYQNTKIENITCETQYGICSEIYTNKLVWLKGISLFKKIDEQKITSQLKDYKEIQTIKIKKQWPDKVNISISLRTVVGAISNSLDSKQIGLIDNDGVVTSVVEKTNLAQLLIPEWQTSIGNVAPIHVNSSKILQQVQNILHEEVIGRVTDRGLVINSKRVEEIVIDPKQSINSWYSPLQRIIDRSKIQNKMPKKIDLRFEQPVLEY